MALDQPSGLEKDTAETKKRVKAARNGHDLHVSLLMHKLGLSKPDAVIMAYLDGHMGLEQRLHTQAKT